MASGLSTARATVPRPRVERNDGRPVQSRSGTSVRMSVTARTAGPDRCQGFHQRNGASVTAPEVPPKSLLDEGSQTLALARSLSLGALHEFVIKIECGFHPPNDTEICIA